MKKQIRLLAVFTLFISQINAQQIVPKFRFLKGEVLGIAKSEYDKGSITFHNGTVMTGDLAVTEKDGKVVQLRLKTANGKKLRFDPDIVKSYGLDPIDDVKEIDLGKNWQLKLHNGQVHLGKLKCRVVNGDTTEFTLKTADKTKMKFNKSEVLYAAMSYDPELAFCSATVTLKSGQELKGNIALGAVKIGSGWNQDQHLQTIFFSADNITQSVIDHTQISGFQRIFLGKTEVYEAYLDGISFHIEDGAAVLIRNPYPTDVREGYSLATKVSSTIVNAAVASGSNKMQQEIEKKQLERKAKKGKYDGTEGVKKLVNDANEAKARIDSTEAQGDRNMKDVIASNPQVYGKEYVILIQGRDPIFVTKANSGIVLETLLYETNEFLQLSKNERKKYTGLGEVEDAVRFYNRYAKTPTPK